MLRPFSLDNPLAPTRLSKTELKSRPIAEASTGACTVRNWPLRHRQHWREAVGVPEIEEHAFRDLACHSARLEVDHEQRLAALNLLRIRPFLLHARQDGPPVIAKVDDETHQLPGAGHV